MTYGLKQSDSVTPLNWRVHRELARLYGRVAAFDPAFAQMARDHLARAKALAPSRIVAVDGETVSFRYRKPKRPGQRKPRYGTATLPVDEFIRRFLLHVLPDGLHRIRHFGILANGSRAKTLESARRAIGAIGCPVDESVADETPEGDHGRDETPEFGTAPVSCPHCGAVLRHVNQISRQHRSHPTRGPPGARPSQGPQP